MRTRTLEAQPADTELGGTEAAGQHTVDCRVRQASLGDSAPPRSGEGDWAAHVDGLEVDDLRLLAVSMPVIEQAKGMLMGYFGCDDTAAFAALRRLSSTRNVKLRFIAAQVVDAGSKPGRTRCEDLAGHLGEVPND